MFHFRHALLLICALAVLSVSCAQPSPQPPAITADNITALRPVRTARWDAHQRPLRIPSGWFALSPDGQALVTGSAPAGATVWDVGSGTLRGAYGLGLEADPTAPPNLIDARFSPDGQWIAALHGAPLPDWPYGVFITPADAPDAPVTALPIPADYGYPFRVWFDAEQPERYVWLEFQPDLFDPSVGARQVARFDLTSETAPLAVPSGPENDPDSVVRIGRIPAPLAITATESGLVRLWDLQTAEVTAEVSLPVAPTFGRVNETEGLHFVWRDAASDWLNLLDFASGQNRPIAPLDGDYVQALLIAPAADVIVGVHRGDSPSVGAWLVETGQYLELGTYWEACTRVPDMVALSDDGARLVIGCDAGFEVWEVGG
jgi:WD40 repeat protein